MNTMTEQAEHFGVNLAIKTSFISAAGTSIMGLLTSSQFGVISGFAIAIFTAIVGIYYKRKDDLRRQERHNLDVRERNARIANLERQQPVPGYCITTDEEPEV